MFQCPVQETARRHGALPALAAPGRMFSYAELNNCVDEAVHVLIQSGVRGASAPVALQPAPTLNSICFLLAGWRLGLTVFLTHARWPALSVQRAAATMGCRSIFVDRLHHTAGHGFERLAVLENLPVGKPCADQPSSDCKQPGIVLMTSGSSASPKAASLSFENLFYNAAGSNEVIPVQPYNRWYLSLPIYHVGGLGILLRCFLSGGTVVLPGPDSRLETILIENKITHVSLVPTQLLRILPALGARRERLQLKALLLGGAAVSPAIIQVAREKPFTGVYFLRINRDGVPGRY